MAAPAEHGAGFAQRSFSTESLPADRRLQTWLQRGWPSVATLFDVRAIEPFSTSAQQFVLDDLIVQFADGSARHFDRTRARLRADRVDVFGINVMLGDGMTITAHGNTDCVPANALLLVDAAQPAKLFLPAGESIQLVLPRDLAEAQLGRVADLHGMIVPPQKSAILVSHLFQLRDALADFSPHQGARLARTVLDTLAIAMASLLASRPALPSGDRPIAHAVRNAIDANLSRPTLGAAWLAKQLGISRSTLYRAFDDQGVESYIRAARLDRVRHALADPANRDAIGDLAYRWGFSDASHLARLFRAAFGTTPSAFRREAREAMPPPA